MKRERTITNQDQPAQQPERIFALAEANRALVLVRRVCNDIVTGYTELMGLKQGRDQSAALELSEERISAIQSRVEHLVERLNALSDELGEMGVILRDWATGLVDFPGTHKNRKVWLCWKLGEESITHWHELDEGYRGRKPITPEVA